MIWKYIRTALWTGPLVVLSTVVMSTVSIVASFFDSSGNTPHRMARVWAKMLLRIGFVRVETEGMEKLDPQAPYVLASNHSSYFDTPVIVASIPLQFRFFAKKGLFSIPFLGTHLQRAGHFPVVRGDPRGSLKSMGESARQIREKRISVLLFPEGGRSENALREFKEGAAHIAIRAGVPLVPVGITGARNVLRMHSAHVMPGTVRIRIGDPIPTDGMGARDRGRLTQMALEQVAAMTGEAVPAIHTKTHADDTGNRADLHSSAPVQ
jgi:1-acyl-sn-glycerol-3-phosphate acyltransferase